MSRTSAPKTKPNLSNSASEHLEATVVQGHTFTISTRYEPKKILGRGSFGVVCVAHDKVRAENIAIKRIRPFANDEWDARHTLREIRLLKLLGSHPNVRGKFPALLLFNFNVRRLFLCMI